MSSKPAKPAKPTTDDVTEGRDNPTDPAPPLEADGQEEPEALFRRMRKAHVESVLQFVRVELVDFMRKNPSYNLAASLPALQRQYESEMNAIIVGEEAIAAGAVDA